MNLQELNVFDVNTCKIQVAIISSREVPDCSFFVVISLIRQCTIHSTDICSSMESKFIFLMHTWFNVKKNFAINVHEYAYTTKTHTRTQTYANRQTSACTVRISVWDPAGSRSGDSSTLNVFILIFRNLYRDTCTYRRTHTRTHANAEFSARALTTMAMLISALFLSSFNRYSNYH